MDDYKKYIEDQPVLNYTGKVDSVKVFSGQNRVLIQGLLVSDPKIKEARIYWDGRRDSIVVPINRTFGVDTLKAAINNLEDRVYNFEIVTFDDQGNKSVKVYAFGRSYGQNYLLSLINRPIAVNSLKTYDNTFSATFSNVDRTLGIFATEVKYTDQNGTEKIKRLGIDENALSLTNVKIGEKMSYRSLYLPDTLCLDTFYTDFTEFKPALTYYRNMGYPFTPTNLSGRWGVLENWESNAAANAISGRGSYDQNSGIGVMASEAGWGTPNINNGKTYQTSTLPQGRYKVQIEFRRNNVTNNVDATNNLIYFIVTSNGTIPNAVDVPNAEKLGYYDLKWIHDDYRIVSFEFDNPSTQNVTIGVVANLMSSSNQYFNVKGITVSIVE
ncbi:DUF4998 domain-containing protein [Sphingobacterium bovisgrunnientis]|uniref:DUF4998 domain-containing protein n=1 Tax=Sphingobacterium bovisgrunnientis TaxID=1874697 RepID=UPI001358094F|nr:DUF4998 domain-containing protein [Sphingobacterium bovisgrunnientis]